MQLRTEAAVLARDSDEVLLSASGAADSDEAFLQQAAVQEALQCADDKRGRLALGEEGGHLLPHSTMERRALRLPAAVRDRGESSGGEHAPPSRKPRAGTIDVIGGDCAKAGVSLVEAGFHADNKVAGRLAGPLGIQLAEQLDFDGDSLVLSDAAQHLQASEVEAAADDLPAVMTFGSKAGKERATVMMEQLVAQTLQRSLAHPVAATQ